MQFWQLPGTTSSAQLSDAPLPALLVKFALSLCLRVLPDCYNCKVVSSDGGEEISGSPISPDIPVNYEYKLYQK
jgi:hypothetical protein